MLIVLEGLDKMGKSTLIKSVAAQMPGVLVTKEPGSPYSKLGPMLRELALNNKELSPLERELLFYLDASQHASFIEKASETILSDRGLWSHLAYLRGYLKTKAMDYEEYAACRNMIDLCCARPDYIVYLRGSLDLMKERSKDEVKDAIESNGTSFFSYVLETYDDLVEHPAWSDKVLVLDATNSIDKNTQIVISWLHAKGISSSRPVHQSSDLG